MDKQSFSKLSKLAESGDTKALFKLGKMCLFGRYVNDLYIPQDKVKGFRLIQQAAALGYTQAQSYLEQRWKECGKMLEPHECPSCGGKGFIKHFWLFDRPCSRCRASGRIYHCPECESHWRSMFNFRVDELREAMSDAGSTPGRPAENPRLSGESTRDPKAARLVEKAKAGKVGFRLNVGAMKFVRKGSLCCPLHTS